MVWTCGALVPPGKNTDAGTPWSMTRISTLSDKWRSGLQSTHTGNTPRFSVWLFNMGASGAWDIVLSTFFTCGKWMLTKHEEWLSWGKNQVMYTHCVVVMRSVWKVHRWLLLCKRDTSPEETHRHRASESYHWAHTWAPNPDSHQPTASKRCSCFQVP